VRSRPAELRRRQRRTLSVADLVVPPPVAEMEEVVFEVTGTVAMGNVAEVAPPGTVIEAGTVATAGRLLASVTTKPAAGAG
jgi:hypothetical protein